LRSRGPGGLAGAVPGGSVRPCSDRRATSRGAAAAPPAEAGRRTQLVDRVADALCDQVQVGHRVEVAQQAEVETTVVAHDRDAERLSLGERRQREDVDELAAEHVERDLGPGDVGDHEVEEPLARLEAARLGEHRRRGETGELGEHLGADRLAALLEAAERLAHHAVALERSGSKMQQRHHRGDAVARHAVFVLAAPLTGTIAFSVIASTCSPRCFRLAQRSHDGDHRR
jgi:hypothetical protein